MSSSSLLGRLGEDVLALVFQHLSRPDFYALCLVDSATRTFTEPLLYSTFEWIWKEEYYPKERTQYDNSPMLPFLQSILHRPQLADHVRNVVLKDSKSEHGIVYDRPLLTISMDRVDMHMMLSTIGNAKVSFVAEWQEALRKGEVDAIVALLLSQLHNLRTLSLNRRFTLYTALSGALFRTAVQPDRDSPLSAFRKLRSVMYRLNATSINGVEQRDSKNLLPLFYLPQIEHLNVSLDNPDTTAWPTPAHKSPMTRLEIECIREKPLAHLLSLTPSLRSLRWEWWRDGRHGVGGLHGHDFDTSLVDLDQFITTLSLVRDTLEDLRIDVETIRNGPFEPYLNLKGSMGGLKHYRRLTRLEAPLPILATFRPDAGVKLQDILPGNIETLILTDKMWPFDAMIPEMGEDEQDIWDCAAITNLLEELLKCRKGSYPFLKAITLVIEQLSKFAEDDLPEKQARMVQLGIEYGVLVDAYGDF